MQGTPALASTCWDRLDRLPSLQSVCRALKQVWRTEHAAHIPSQVAAQISRAHSTSNQDVSLGLQYGTGLWPIITFWVAKRMT